MGRVIKSILVLAILVLGVAPWGVGMLVENKYKRLLEQVNKHYGDELQFTV